MSEGLLSTYVRDLRNVLEDDPQTPQFIETVMRRGYRFIAPLTTAAPPVSGSTVQVQGGNPTSSTQPPPPFFVGRKQELAQLHDWWEKALNGGRQFVFVTGEPGIGKTTLVETFLNHVVAESNVWTGRGQCIEHHGAGEAYMPVLEALGRLCRMPEGERLIALLSQYAPTWLVQMPALLSAGGLEALQRKVQGATRERMLREMTEAVEALTAEQPFVLWLEDLHWSDVSTLDLLAVLARRREPARLMVIGTYRPVEVLGNGHPLTSVTQELYGHHLCAGLAPQLLTAADIADYLHRRFPESTLPTDWPQTLYRRTGGNPLFLVNMIEDLMARGVMVQVDGRWTLESSGETAEREVPESIRELIARQGARLRPAEQQVLEVASVAGMEFSVAAVAAGLEADVVEVEERCAGLAHRQQFLRPAGISEWPDGTVAARYGFLHALYQQLWHERVSIGRLQRLHLRIGERKEAAYSARAGEIAAELAVHFEQGRDYRRTIQYLQQAAQSVLQRSANVEAVSHLTKGLALLKTLPDTLERTQHELSLQIALGVPLTATKGYAAPEVESAYARARELCRLTGETPQLFPMLRGLWQFYFVRGETSTAHELATQLLRLAERTQDPVFLLTAYQALGLALFALGELQSARVTLEQGIALDKQQPNRFLRGFIQSPAVNCLSYDAWTLWYLGYPDQALQRSHEALTLAQELAQPLTMAFALYWAATVYWNRGEGQAARERAEALLTLASEHGFRHFLAQGAIMRGWVLAEQGQVETGLALTQRGMAGYQASGAGAGWPQYLGWLAEAHRKAGKVEEGLTVLAEALEMANKTEQRVYETELHRLKGTLTLQSSVQTNQKTKGKGQKKSSVQSLGSSIQKEAEACFLKAIEIARKQQAKSLELRAVTSLSRLWQQQGRQEEARQMLAEIYGWFTEGFDTKDLQEAKALLEELG